MASDRERRRDGRQRRRRVDDVARRRGRLRPNFKRRLSGVTSTIVQLVPLQARTLGIATLGPGPAGRLAADRLAAGSSACCSRPRGRPFRIWHARRNVEMIAGIAAARHAARAAEAGLHLGRAAQSPAADQMADPAHGCGDRHQSALGQLPRGAAHRDHARRRPREVPPARRSPEDAFSASGLPGQRAIGCFGRVRHQKGTDLFVDAMIALLPEFPDWTAVVTGRVTAEHQAFAGELRAPGRRGRSGRPHRFPRRGARHKALVSAHLALCRAVAQRRFRPDAAGGDGIRLAGRRQRCRRLCRPDRRRRDRLCRPCRRRRGADAGDPRLSVRSRRCSKRTAPTRSPTCASAFRCKARRRRSREVYEGLVGREIER